MSFLNPVKPPKPNQYTTIAGQDLNKSSDYFSNVLSNPAAATATTTSDLGKQFQQGINFNKRNAMRSGGTGAKIAEAPFNLASAAKGQQILAQMGAAKQLGETGLGAGSLDLTQQGQDIDRQKANAQFWASIGESIGGALIPGGGMLSKIFKKSPSMNSSGMGMG